MAKNKHTHYDAAEARILRNDAIISAVMASDGARFDSAEDASVFFARELDYVKTKSYDVQYPELTALTLFPISHEADAGAETVTYYTYDKSGMPFMQHQLQVKNLETIIPCESRVAGMIVYYPMSALIAVGVSKGA